MSGFKAKFFLFSFLILFLSVVNAGSIEQVNDGMYKGYLEDRPSFEFVLERLYVLMSFDCLVFLCFVC